MNSRDSSSPSDTLDRFIDAQGNIYPQALKELREGEKHGHWMWFIFPQIAGLGYSRTSQYYAIKDLDEARAYLAQPVLGARLVECAEAVLAVEGRSALAIFGAVDELKFRSSMTLFAKVAGPVVVFSQILDKYFEGKQDDRTLTLLNDPGTQS